MKARVWMIGKAFDGFPNSENFKLIEQQLPEVTAGKFLTEAVCWSVDPYNRAYNPPAGVPHIGFQVAKVVSSQNPDYPVGMHVMGHFGWRTHTVCDPKEFNNPQYKGDISMVCPLPPDLGALPLSAGVGILGMPGFSSYFGLEVLEAKPGDTLVVNSAAGAVGSVVGQLAKARGCKVIGYAGTDEKVKWLVDELGFDAAFNYKTTVLTDTLSSVAADGVDCFFDNVGGRFANTVLSHMNVGGRVCQCGSISNYNVSPEEIVEFDEKLAKTKKLNVVSFAVLNYAEKWPQALESLVQLVKEGKLNYREYLYHGFEQMPQAMIDQMSGKNIGKVIVWAK